MNHNKNNIRFINWDTFKGGPFAELFAKFCTSSTIHGTYFWITPHSIVSRMIWVLIVILGGFSATWIINESFRSKTWAFFLALRLSDCNSWIKIWVLDSWKKAQVSNLSAWKENPVITSVMQKSIEEISFPAITICPQENTRWEVMPLCLTFWAYKK